MSQCKKRLKSDCCCICLQFEASESLKVPRSTKQDTWISCDCCKQWLHASCGGFTASQYNKICREGLWIKCVVCCLQQILTTGTDEGTSVTESIIQAAKNRLSKAPACKGKKRKQSKVLSSESKVEEGNSLSYSCSSQGVDLIAVTDTAEDNSINKVKQFSYSTPLSSTSRNTDTVDQSLYSSKVPQRTHAHATGNDVHSDALCGTQKSVSINNEYDINKILIVDNIDGALDFSSSRRILQEIHLYFPTVKIDFAYSLAKGGVAIHTTCEEDRDLLLSGLPAESFGRGVKHLPKGSRDHTVFVKGVDTTVDVSPNRTVASRRHQYH